MSVNLINVTSRLAVAGQIEVADVAGIAARKSGQRLGSINPLIDGFPTYWGWLQRVLNPGSWKFDRNLVAVAQGYGVIWVVAA